MVRLTDRPDMALDVYRGRKTTRQQQQHYSLKKNYFLNPNHFSTNMLNCFNFFAFSFGNSSTSFGIFCLFQEYVSMYCSLNFLYKGHSKTKWNSSSKVLHNLHFLSSIGILLGFANLTVSTSNLCDHSLNWLKLLRYFDITNISKPAFAAMHGPHSLVRIGPGCADRA